MALWAGAIAAIALAGVKADIALEGRYTELMYREAIERRQSTSPPFVLVTIINAAGMEKTGCTSVGALAAAISLQLGWKPDRPKPNEHEVDAFLIRAKDRRFYFQDERFLAGSGFYTMAQNEQACAYLRKGIPAFRADITGQIVPGTPGHVLAISPQRGGN